MHETLADAPHYPKSNGALLLRDVSWKVYESLLKELESHRVSLTYDRGTLEIMSPSRTHDFGKKLIARLIETMADELYIDIVSGGSTTCRREDLEKGLEPDELYYFKNAARMLNRDKDLDLTRDPPPDLAVEIDVTSRSLDRQPIYAALGILELWRCKNKSVQFLHLDSHKKYRAREKSLNFPFLSSRAFCRFLEMQGTVEERKILRLFREFVRQTCKSR